MQCSNFDSRYVLVQDSQDIQSIGDSLGINLSDYSSLFVLINDGDYVEIWASEYYIPYVNVEYSRIA